MPVSLRTPLAALLLVAAATLAHANPTDVPAWRATLTPPLADAAVRSAGRCAGEEEAWHWRHQDLVRERERLDAAHAAALAERAAHVAERSRLDAESTELARERSRLNAEEAELGRLQREVERLHLQKRRDPGAAERSARVAESLDQRAAAHGAALRSFIPRSEQLQAALAQFNETTAERNRSATRLREWTTDYASRWEAFADQIATSERDCAPRFPTD
jgi:hypothetical protein